MVLQSVKIKSRNSGQALVETALILLILFFLMFAIIEFGRYLYLQNSVTNAAREGARAGAVAPAGSYAADIAAAVTGALSSSTPGLYITPAPVSAPNAGESVKVNVRMSFRNVVPLLLPQFLNLTSIRATAVMRRE
jgi:Flp pilus assembly protein TadG